MKKYIGMAWPSDGLNDSEDWSYLSSNYELLIIRYPVSGSFKKKLLIKEGKIKFISQFLKNIKLDNLDALMLCDFASSVLNGKKYILKTELFFKKKLNVPVFNIVTSSLNFIDNHKNKISIVSPYKNNITNTFLELIKDKKIIDKIFNLNFKSEKEINLTKNIIDYKKFKNLNSDLLFIGGGISVRYYKKYLQKKIKNKIYSSPMLLVKDTIKKIK